MVRLSMVRSAVLGLFAAAALGAAAHALSNPAAATAPACPAPPADAAPLFAAHEPLTIRRADGTELTLSVRLAATPEQTQRGLMFTPDLAEGEGMLFHFGPPTQRYMWMKNTCLSLDMLFLGPDGRVTGVARGARPFSERLIPSPGPAAGVLEVEAGVAASLGLGAGAQVIHPLFGAAGAGDVGGL